MFRWFSIHFCRGKLFLYWSCWNLKTRKNVRRHGCKKWSCPGWAPWLAPLKQGAGKRSSPSLRKQCNYPGTSQAHIEINRTALRDKIRVKALIQQYLANLEQKLLTFCGLRGPQQRHFWNARWAKGVHGKIERRFWQWTLIKGTSGKSARIAFQIKAARHHGLLLSGSACSTPIRRLGAWKVFFPASP